MQIRKVSKNILANLLTQITQIVVNFILPPLMIGVYGSAINGLVSTARQLLSYANLVGAGISAASIQSLYKPLAEDNQDGINGVYNAANKMFNQAGSLFSIIVLALAFGYPLVTADELSYWLVFGVILVTSIAGLSEFFIVGKYRTLLYAAQKEYVISYVQVLGILVGFILSFVYIKLHANIIIVQAAASFLYLARIVLLSVYVKRHYPFLDATVPALKTLNSKRNNAMIHQFTGLATLSSQLLILGSFVSLEAASIYAVYNIVFAGMQSILAHFINTFTPFIGKTIAKEDNFQLQHDYKYVEYCFSTILAILISVVALLLFPFINLYMANADIVYADNVLAVLFVIFACCNLFRLPGQMLINASGHFKETKWQAIIEASLCVTLQLILAPIWGIYGVLVASIIALGWRCMDILLYSNKKILYRNFRDLFKYIGKLLSVPLLIILIFSMLPHVILSSFVELMASGCVIGVMAFLVCLLYDYAFYRKQLVAIISKVKTYL